MKTIPNIAMYVLFVLTCTVAHAHPVAPIHYMKIYLIDNNMISTHYSVQLTLLSIDPCVCERNGGRELQATRGGGVGRGAWGVGRGAWGVGHLLSKGCESVNSCGSGSSAGPWRQPLGCDQLRRNNQWHHWKATVNQSEVKTIETCTALAHNGAHFVQLKHFHKIHKWLQWL